VEEARSLHGEPDVIRVHREFNSSEDAHSYEYRFLKRVNAKSSSRWLNQTIMGAPMGGTPNQVAWAKKPKSLETREKMRQAALKRWANDDVNRERASKVFKTDNPNSGGKVHKGRVRSEIQRQNIASGQIRRYDRIGRKAKTIRDLVPREVINARISESLKSHQRTDEHKANIARSYNNSEEARANRKAAQQARRRREQEKKRGLS